MMFRSVRLTIFRVTAALLCAVLLAAGMWIALHRGAPDTVSIRGEAYPLGVADEGDITALLSVCGYAEPKLIRQTRVRVPENWNEAYQTYSILQAEQGFDLTPYKSSDALEQVYSLGDGRYAVLLLARDRVIAAHLSEMDGVSEPQPLIPTESQQEVNDEGTTG